LSNFRPSTSPIDPVYSLSSPFRPLLSPPFLQLTPSFFVLGSSEKRSFLRFCASLFDFSLRLIGRFFFFLLFSLYPPFFPFLPHPRIIVFGQCARRESGPSFARSIGHYWSTWGSPFPPPSSRFFSFPPCFKICFYFWAPLTARTAE